MKVFANDVKENPAMKRIETAFKKYPPEGVEFVETEEEADLVIIYAFAHRKHVQYRAERLRAQGKKYAIVQLAVRSTANPGTDDWARVWTGAELVWSYYDLERLCKEDKTHPIFKFYRAPLGVDTEVFHESQFRRDITIIVGNSRDESVNECREAAKGNIHMLGGGVDEGVLAQIYSQAQYVSGLRRKEGFEMPVIEGLMCGARPIC